MFILPLVLVAVPSIGVLLPCRGVVWRVWDEIAVSMVTLPVAIEPIVIVRVMTGNFCMIMRCQAPAEALAQGELSCQLSDGLPLVQDGLFLLHKALPKVEDGGLGLFTCPPPPSRRCTLMTSGTCCTYSWTGGREAGGVHLHRKWGTNKAGVGSMIIVRL